MGEGRLFLEWKSIGLSSYKLSRILSYLLHVGLMLKSVHHPIPTRGNGENPRNFQKESVSSPVSWVVRYILFLAKLTGRGRLFLKGARRAVTLWDSPQEHLVVIRDEKVSPFVKFKIIYSYHGDWIRHFCNISKL